MRKDGGRRTGEEDTVLVTRERMIMVSGSTERGVARGTAPTVSKNGPGGMLAGCSVSVEVRLSDDEMYLREVVVEDARFVFALSLGSPLLL